jgi:hypothetical protein
MARRPAELIGNVPATRWPALPGKRFADGGVLDQIFGVAR